MTWIRGDALNAHDVLAAANGCSVIVHAVNPPGIAAGRNSCCRCWTTRIAAASAVGATIVLPGTVYNFGPDAFPVLTEESPQHPVTRKGAIRVEMERRLLAASKNGGSCADRAGRRFFRTQGGQQLVLARVGQAGQAGHGSQQSRPVTVGKKTLREYRRRRRRHGRRLR